MVNNMFVLLGYICYLLILIDGCRFGDEANCAFPCGCTNNQCDPQTGQCINSECNRTLPEGFGWGGPGCRIGNVAYNKAASQSGTYKTFHAYKAVDGNTWPYSDDPMNTIESCANPWRGGYVNGPASWDVDLGKLYTIINITIVPRQATENQLQHQKTIQSRTNKSYLRIGNLSDISTHKDCTFIDEAIVGNATLTCDQGLMVGRYVSFNRTWKSSDRDDINLCEFIVMGYEFIDCSACPGFCSPELGCDLCPEGKMLPDCERDCKWGYWGSNCNTKLYVNNGQMCMADNDECVQYSSWPGLGPKAGGTSIIVTGDILPHYTNITILIGGRPCNTSYVNSTTISGLSPLLTLDDEALESPVPVELEFPGGIVVDTKLTFTYKKNPVIYNVFPLDTINRGGTKHTVTGKNFDSVAEPKMITTVVYKSLVSASHLVFNTTTHRLVTVCEVVLDDLMLCLTPYIQLDIVETSTNERVKRHRPFNAFEYEKVGDTLLRPRREAVRIDRTPRGGRLEFYIGFSLDGVDEYLNYSSINVFTEPVFRLHRDVIFYKLGQRLVFEGEDLDVGVTVYDYNITVGTETCTELELLSNSLSCLPPQAKPDSNDANVGPEIMINIGIYIEHFAGTLQYATKYAENKNDKRKGIPQYVTIPVAIVAVIIILAIIIVVAAICANRRKCCM